MNLFQLISLLVTLTALLSFVNRRFLKLPTTIGVTVVGVAVSVLVLGLVALHFPAAEASVHLLKGIQFDDVLFQILLRFRLFSGELSVPSRSGT